MKKIQSSVEYLVMLAIASTLVIAAIAMATKLKSSVSIDVATKVGEALKNLTMIT
ncbi:MAG: hypothetical protein ACPLXS_00775 [Candidatus Micrarchaeales archaeon]